MAGVMETLKEINATRLELTDLRGQIKRMPVQLKAKENEVEKAKQEIAAGKEVAKRMRVEADSRELTLKQAESRIKDLKAKLNQIDSNKEYQVILDEIHRIQTQNDALQDEILAKITEEEEKRAAIRELEEKFAHTQEEFAKVKELIDYKTDKLKGQVAILKDKLAELEPQLGESAGDYKRLTGTKGDQGLAECVSGTCQACFSDQPPQTWQDLIGGRPTICRHCGALLYKS